MEKVMEGPATAGMELDVVEAPWVLPQQQEGSAEHAASRPQPQQLMTAQELLDEKEELAKMRFVNSSRCKIGNMLLQSEERLGVWPETAVTASEKSDFVDDDWEDEWFTRKHCAYALFPNSEGAMNGVPAKSGFDPARRRSTDGVWYEGGTNAGCAHAERDTETEQHERVFAKPGHALGGRC